MNVLRLAFVGAACTGTVAFALGFFGPLILTPDANQGPLLGIFITGPLGFLAGAVGGVVVGIRRARRTGADVPERHAPAGSRRA